MMQMIWLSLMHLLMMYMYNLTYRVIQMHVIEKVKPLLRKLNLIIIAVAFKEIGIYITVRLIREMSQLKVLSKCE